MSSSSSLSSQPNLAWGAQGVKCAALTPCCAENSQGGEKGGVGCWVAMVMRMMLAAPWEDADLPGSGGEDSCLLLGAVDLSQGAGKAQSGGEEGVGPWGCTPKAVCEQGKQSGAFWCP